MTEILAFVFGISLCLNVMLIVLIKFYLRLKKDSKNKLLEVVDSAEAQEFLS